MECYYHPSRESTDNCAICGKSICKECGLEIAGKTYCKDCLEKIVGLSLNNEAPKAEHTPEPVAQPAREPVPEPVREPVQEPPRLERQESAAEQIQMANLTRETPREVQFSNQKISDDSPYNIKSNIKYEGGLESTYDQPRESLNQAITNNQVVPEEPVQNVRQEYAPEPDPFMQEVLREPVQQARNEYDFSNQVQAPPADDYIYPDHSYQPQETTARQNAVEDKYERYLDDLYFDEVEEVPLNEQLARDEEQYGSLTRHEYRPRNTYEQQKAADDDLDRRIREELARRENPQKRERVHNIQYEDEKEPYDAVDIILTIILIIVIIIVLLYILYVFKLSATYTSFLEAMLGIRDPATFMNALTR